MDPAPDPVDHDHKYNPDEFDYSSEEIEPSDDEGPSTTLDLTVKRGDDDNDAEASEAPTARVKRSDDDEIIENDVRSENGDDDSVVAYSSHHDDEHHRRRHHRYHHSKWPEKTTSRVRMPTGKTRDVIISMHTMRGWKCGQDKTKLVDLDTNDREYKIVAEQMEKTKKDYHQTGTFKSYNILKIQRAVNGCFCKRYKKRQHFISDEAGYRNERMLFHGSSAVKELLKFGFDERYANINGMFGAGVYFARHSSKCNQYAFGMVKPCPTHGDMNCDICERKMLLCRVTMGKVKKETQANKRSHPPPGYHSVKGEASPGGLKYDEYIVYRGEQVYAEFVITYKIVK